MIPYSTFALTVSFAIVVEYAVLMGIAFRRARFGQSGRIRASEGVTVHARRVEGPLLTVCLVVALASAVSALSLFWPEYATFARLLGFSIVRGVLLFGGFYLLGWYWTVRETWI